MMLFRGFSFRNFIHRFSFLILLPGLIWYALNLLLPPGVFAALCDGVVFFLAVYSIIAGNEKTTSVFKGYGSMDSIQWLIMFVLYVSVSAIMAVLWSVRWRASGHLSTYGDDQLRAGFRYVAALGFASFVVSQGDYESRVPPRRWITLVSLILSALAVVGLGVYSDQITDGVVNFLHDRAPSVPFGVKTHGS